MLIFHHFQQYHINKSKFQHYTIALLYIPIHHTMKLYKSSAVYTDTQLSTTNFLRKILLTTKNLGLNLSHVALTTGLFFTLMSCYSIINLASSFINNP